MSQLSELERDILELDERTNHCQKYSCHTWIKCPKLGLDVSSCRILSIPQSVQSDSINVYSPSVFQTCQNCARFKAQFGVMDGVVSVSEGVIENFQKGREGISNFKCSYAEALSGSEGKTEKLVCAGWFPSSPSFIDDEIEFFKADWPLVGDGVKHASCGTFWTKVCLEKHNPLELPEGISHQKGLDCKCLHDGVAILRVKMSCHRPICPECWPDWRKRQVARAKHRFEASEKDYNREEKRHVKRCHGAVSVPKELWYLSEPEMKKQALKHLKTIGIDGGTIIYHSKRERKKQKGVWYYSPHFHVYFHAWNAWVDGEKVKELNKKCGWIFRNFGERVLGKSISYQLSHASVPPNHGHVVTWFGSMNYRMLHVEKWHGERSRCPWGHYFDRYGRYSGKEKLELPNREGYQAYLSREGWEYLTKKRPKKRGDG